MSGIFISYRREDSSGWVGSLSRALRESFGEDQVFRDIDTLEPGVDYGVAIEQRLASCDVVLVVIGPRWLTTSDKKGQRRLDDPKDLARIEAAVVLRRRIPVVPVLVGGATMPSADDLPEELRELARRNAYELSDRRWDYDQEQLIKVLEKPGYVGRPSHSRSKKRSGFLSGAKGRWIIGSSVAALSIVGASAIVIYVLVEQPPGQSGLGLRSKLRPVPPGASISSGSTAGTACCVVQDPDGRRLLLSTEGAVGDPGTPVYQPGRADGGGEWARIGQVFKVRPVQPGIANVAAGALVEFAPGIDGTMMAPGLGPIRGVARSPRIGQRVRALGRTSGLVEGEVKALAARVPTKISKTETVELVGMIETSPISAPGDAGAPVVNDGKELIGFVYAGSKISTLVMPIQPVLDLLGVRLAD